MTKAEESVKHVGLVVKKDDEALKTAEALAAWLTDKGVRVSTRRGYTAGADTPSAEDAPSDLYRQSCGQVGDPFGGRQADASRFGH